MTAITQSDVAGWLALMTGQLGLALPQIAGLTTLALFIFFIVPRFFSAFEWLEKRREARIGPLLEELQKPFTWQNSFAFEQVFLRFLGQLVDYQDLQVLLEMERPSRALLTFCDLINYIRIDYEKKSFVFSSNYATPAKRIGRRLFYTFAYLMSSGMSGILIMAGYNIAGRNGQLGQALGLWFLAFLLFLIALGTLKISDNCVSASYEVLGERQVMPDFRRLFSNFWSIATKRIRRTPNRIASVLRGRRRH